MVVGHWNPMIFSSAWISSHLTTIRPIGIEVPLDNPGLPYRYAFEDIHLCVSRHNLALSVDRPEDRLLEKCRDVASKILAELPHTPMLAVGINYQFIAEQPDGPLLDIFNLQDNNGLSDDGVIIQSSLIQRSLLVDGQIINLALSLTPEKKVLASFNFHKDTSTAQQAQEFLHAFSTNFKERSIHLLSTIYRSTVEPIG